MCESLGRPAVFSSCRLLLFVLQSPPCLFDHDSSLTYTSLFHVRPFFICYTATYLYKGIKDFLATMYITRVANEAGVLGFSLGGLQLIMLGLGTFTRHLSCAQ